MKISRYSLLVIAFWVLAAGVGCKTVKEKEDELISKPIGRLPNQNADNSFQAFLSTLRKAAAKKDLRTLADMMTPDFGYSWEPGGEGVGVFDYWEYHRLWKEVNAVLNEKFVPSGDFMVAPAEVSYNPDYQGYRAGLRLVGGAWRFAYFVPAPPE